MSAAHELERGPTGYVVSMREEADLVRQDEAHYLIEAVDGDGDDAVESDESE
ncbi:hypothetical protein ACFQRB_13365 [Halobaculum litoreum]|uniref:Uncharacterized protein n=1 Tax=Halobaculum litoreum TaxID=3031998 RepID=A0ABD5XPV7_9EURY